MAGFVYIVFIALTQPERLIPGDAPAFAEAGVQEAGGSEGGAAETDAAGAPDGAVNAPEPGSGTPDLSGGGADLFLEGEAVGVENIFTQFAYYEPDKLRSYENFQSRRSELDAGEVVWMVNAGLDGAFYENAEVVSGGNPLLINPYHRLPEDFVPEELAYIDESGRQATPETVEAFYRLRDAARGEGYDLAVQSAYRTLDYQRGLYERESGDGAVARPAYSEHHTGRALDLWGPDGLLDESGPTPTGQWVARHAHEFGFIVRYTAENQAVTGYIYEPWHITYVGTAIAGEMRSGGYGSLEEYVAKNPQAGLTQ
jgi:D-alanyl-D-alanine carboxypeptidase